MSDVVEQARQEFRTFERIGRIAGEKLIDEIETLRGRIAELERGAEPVCYRYKFTDPISGRPVWRSSSAPWNGQAPCQVQALYAAPPPADAREIEARIWWEAASKCMERINDYSPTVQMVLTGLYSYFEQRADAAMGKEEGE